MCVENWKIKTNNKKTRQIFEKNENKTKIVYQVFIHFKKVYDSVGRENLYNILIDFGIHTKLVRLIKMCLTETYSIVRVGKNFSERFPMKMI
jgi:hypothetical protein